jgi:hypothetical protein
VDDLRRCQPALASLLLSRAVNGSGGQRAGSICGILESGASAVVREPFPEETRDSLQRLLQRGASFYGTEGLRFES